MTCYIHKWHIKTSYKRSRNKGCEASWIPAFYPLSGDHDSTHKYKQRLEYVIQVGGVNQVTVT